MPIYEYQCQKCGIHIERRQSVSEEPLKICAECGGELVKKTSLSGFQFKGGGWYVTDYAGKGGKPDDKTTAGNSEKTSAGESTTGSDDASKSKGDTPAASKEEAPASKK